MSRSSSSPAIFKSKMADARKASGSVAFPVTRLLSSPAIVVAYSSEFVRDFSDKSSPRRKRYALILKSVSREARGELETYFSAVLEDILSVRQVSVVCLHLPTLVTNAWHFPASNGLGSANFATADVSRSPISKLRNWFHQLTRECRFKS